MDYCAAASVPVTMTRQFAKEILRRCFGNLGPGLANRMKLTEGDR
jgi:hypothetical protein